MGKAILFSILVATIAFPAIAARDRSPQRGMKRMLLALSLFNVVWLLLLVLVYARCHAPEIL